MTPPAALLRASIDSITGNVLRGWLFGAITPVRPFLLVDDRPALLLDAQIPRPDVCAAFGMATAEQPGFAFRLPRALPGARLRLFGLTSAGAALVLESTLEQVIAGANLHWQLAQAARLADEAGSVAIACGDCSPAALKRALTLYEIAAHRRPTVLVTWRLPTGAIAPALLNWPGCLLALPAQRAAYVQKLLRSYKPNFGTVWICKPDLASFRLANAVADGPTRMILDMDGRACNTGTEANLARSLAAQISARTASAGTVPGSVRIGPARQQGGQRQLKGDGPLRVAVAGAAGQDAVALSRAINILGTGEGLRIELHAHGDIEPEYCRQLKNAGATVHDEAELPETLAGAAALVCGSLTGNTADSSEILAAIADGLAAGVPVLAPENVADMANTPGVYPFNQANFLDQLLAALRRSEPVGLPQEFGIESASQAFQELEGKTVPRGPLRGLPRAGTGAQKAAPALVLVWKQRDAGFYGRRIDQIARSYKKACPDHRVIILEFMPEGEAEPGGFAAEAGALSEWIAHKKHGTSRDGVFYRLIAWRDQKDIYAGMEHFLEQQDLRPENALFVLYPVIDPLPVIEELLEPYRKIADIVDNQYVWAQDDERRCFLNDHYFRVMQSVEKIFFNNRANLACFTDMGFAARDRTALIPNWYNLPPGIAPGRVRQEDDCRHAVYSGNMNDRIDWEILQRVAEMPGIQLHLIGVADKRQDELDALLAAGTIYHGPMSEAETLALLQEMDLAIVAHKCDPVSRYMNPLKLGMYEKMNLPALTPEWLEAEGRHIVRYSNWNDLAEKIAGIGPGEALPAAAAANAAEAALIAQLAGVLNSMR